MQFWNGYSIKIVIKSSAVICRPMVCFATYAVIYYSMLFSTYLLWKWLFIESAGVSLRHASK